jgi:5-methylcytosine-specific restriction protein A
MLCHQTLQNALSDFAQSYVHNRTNNEFAGNELACCIRQCIPTILRHIIHDRIRNKAIENHDYTIKGSPGQGNWATIPWIAVMDERVTDTVQNGFFVIYSLKADGSGLYLSINQGVSVIRQNYGNDALNVIVRRREALIKKINIDKPNGFETGPIEYNAPDNTDSVLTQNSTIISKLYNSNSIPQDKYLINDLISIMLVYQNIVSNIN